MQDITHPKDLLANNKRFRALARGTGKNFVIEKRYLRPDGSSVWVQNDVSGIRDRQNKVRHIVAVSTDITDRKNQETALQKSKELLEKLIQQRTKALRVSNAELKNEIARRQGLEGEILAVSDREQQRLGQELHDGLCQHLTAVAFMTRSVAMRLRNHRVIDASDIEKIAELVNNAAADTRELSRALHRVDVDAAGLVTALQDLVDREIWKVPCRLEVKPSFHIKDDAAAAQFYRIAREAVINANKHAQAREIVIKLERSPGGMIMHVCDDGVGFPTDRRMKQGLGYHIMNYRAQQIGARLEIDSRKGGGTRVSCCLPNRRLKPGKPDKAENSRKKRFPARIRKALTVLV
jgi:signal transduction histidine kinase